MKEIIFATGNTGKIVTLRNYFKTNGLPIKVVQKSLDLIEPQAATAAEVAGAKARQAYAILGKPVLVDDSSFHIYALGGFPGPYIKYMLETIGIEGIMKFMDGQSDRRAYFMSSLVFIDENGQPHVFNGKDAVGVIVEKADERDHPEAWSELWKIFSPPGSGGETYSQMDRQKLNDHNKKKEGDSAYGQFVEWLQGV